MQHEEVLRPAVGEEVFESDPEILGMCITQDVDLKPADSGITEHLRERIGVVGRRCQPVQIRVKVLVIRHDQRDAGGRH